jgi:DNA-binding CsgD family transcriptional regulator
MAAIDSIRYYLQQDEEGVGRHLEDFVSVPAFIYYLQKDSYLSASKALLHNLGLALNGLRFQSFLERMHPNDRLHVLSSYSREVPALMHHREGQPTPALQTLRFRIKDSHQRYRAATVKIDIAGFDAAGRPDKVLGVFWLEETPLDEVERVWEQPMETLGGDALAMRITAVHQHMKRAIHQDGKKAPVITPREKDIMHGLAKGFSTKVIAQQLGISFHTVETHRKILLQKFEARNTVQMMLKAGRWLPEDFWK